MPKDYKRVLQSMRRVTQAGLTGEEAIMAAFEENAKDVARVGGRLMSANEVNANKDRT